MRNGASDGEIRWPRKWKCLVNARRHAPAHSHDRTQFHPQQAATNRRRPTVLWRHESEAINGMVSVERRLGPPSHPFKIGILTVVLPRSRLLPLFPLNSTRLFFFLFNLLGLLSRLLRDGCFAWSRNADLLWVRVQRRGAGTPKWLSLPPRAS